MKTILVLTIYLASAIAVAAGEQKGFDYWLKGSTEDRRKEEMLEQAKSMCKPPFPNVNSKAACMCYYETVNPVPKIDGWFPGIRFDLWGGWLETSKSYFCNHIIGIGNVTFAPDDQTDDVYLNLVTNPQSTCELKDLPKDTGAKNKANKYIDCPPIKVP